MHFLKFALFTNKQVFAQNGVKLRRWIPYFGALVLLFSNICAFTLITLSQPVFILFGKSQWLVVSCEIFLSVHNDTKTISKVIHVM